MKNGSPSKLNSGLNDTQLKFFREITELYKKLKRPFTGNDIFEAGIIKSKANISLRMRNLKVRMRCSNHEEYIKKHGTRPETYTIEKSEDRKKES